MLCYSILYIRLKFCSEFWLPSIFHGSQMNYHHTIHILCIKSTKHDLHLPFIYKFTNSRTAKGFIGTIYYVHSWNYIHIMYMDISWYFYCWSSLINCRFANYPASIRFPINLYLGCVFRQIGSDNDFQPAICLFS